MGQADTTTGTPVQLGPSAARARPGDIAVAAWLAGPGERIKKHAPLVELRVDDALIVLTAPVTGTLRNIQVRQGQAVRADTVLALLDPVEPALDDRRKVLDRIDAAADPGLEIVSALLDIVAVKDPPLAEAARACAIPHLFGPEVLAMLSGADAAEASRLFAELQEFQFVRTRADGQCSYDESTRDALLREWRQPDRRDLFAELNRRMWAYQEGEHDRVRQLEADLRRISPVLREVNYYRYTELASKVDGLVRATLLELLYYTSQVSGDDLYSMFRRLFLDYEFRGRLLLCQSLLQATRSYMQGIAPDSQYIDWLEYWEGRMLGRLRVDDEADHILSELIERLPHDGMLKQWALSALGDLRYAQTRLTEAGQLYRRQLDMAESSGVDPWNLPTSHVGVANINMTVGDYDAAIEHYQRALECSAALPESNVPSEVAAWTGLSEALRGLGRLREAREAALAALDLARSELPTQTQLQAEALLQLIASVMRADVRLSATLYAEAEHLIVETDDAPDTSAYPLRYAEILLNNGRVTAGRTVLDAAHQRNAGGREDQGTLALLEARAAAKQGRFQTAIERLTEMLDREEPLSEWQRIIALSSRGSYYTACGRWREADADHALALESWDRVGNEEGVADSQVDIADLRYRTGDLTAAEDALARASAILGSRRTAVAANLHKIRSKVLHAQGRVTEAAAEASEACQIYRDLEQPVNASREALHMAAVAASYEAWSEATKAAIYAAQCGKALDKLDGWSPSSRQRSTDRANSQGVRELTDESADPRQAALLAREFFDVARHGLPGNPWYYLNLSYAHARLEAWDRAVAALERATKVKSALLKTFLRHRLIEYRLRLAELQAGTDGKQAASTLAKVVADVDKTTPWPLRIKVAMMRGDMLLRSPALDHKAAAQAYLEGLEEAERHRRRADEVALQVRLAVVAAQRDDVAEAARRLSAALEAVKSVPGEPPADQLTAVCAAVLTTPAQYTALAQVLALVEEGGLVRAGPPGVLADVRLQLVQTWYWPSIQASERTAPEDKPPLLLIEADEALFPDGAQTPGVVRMLEQHIPAVRDRIQRDMGVSLPAVSIRAQGEATPGAYVLRVNQIPLTSGQVVREGVFCEAQAARTAGLDGIPHQDPVTGKEGLWLVGAARAAAEGLGLPTTDAYEFLVRHLEAVARAELPMLVGIQDLRRLVEALPVTGQLTEWERLTESGRTDRVRLLFSVVHALLSENVPVRSLATIVSVVAAAAPDGAVGQALREVRAALRHDLPWRKGAGGLLRLRDELERELTAGLGDGNEEHVVIARGNAEELRRAVRSDVANTEPIRALLIRDQVIRPFVHTLIARDIGGLPVVSEPEVFARGAPANTRPPTGGSGT
jgi:tetratricopeptide (TPR) repeat protein